MDMRKETRNMTNSGVVNIHGKDYVTVAKRLQMFLDANKEEGNISITTEILSHDPIVIRAVVKIKERVFHGISSVALDTAKFIEKSNPYEVAETSAVGRALGFAGFGSIDSIASADEVIKAESVKKGEEIQQARVDEDGYTREPVVQSDEIKVCSKHDSPIPMKKGTSKSTGKTYWYHRDEATKKICFGSGWMD